MLEVKFPARDGHSNTVLHKGAYFEKKRFHCDVCSSQITVDSRHNGTP